MKIKLLLLMMLFSVVGWGQVYQHNFGTTAISVHPHSVTPNVFDVNLSTSSWSNSKSTWTSFAGSTGEAIAMSNSGGTSTITLTFNVASGFQTAITKFNFWRQRSTTGAQNWSMTINGIAVGSGTVPTTGAAIGLTNVSNAVSNLTGTVIVVISLSGATGTGTFRLDDFTLDGAVTSTAPSPEINLQGNATTITDEDISPIIDDNTDFGSAGLSSGTIAKTFTIQNTGTAMLDLTDAIPYVVISGIHASDFTLTATPSNAIPAAESTTFEVTFNPSGAGVRTAEISIANNDSSESLYNFWIQGTGIDVPIITSDLTASGSQGTAFSYAIAAVNSPTSYSATGLPAGLSVDTVTGVVSGTPSAAGTFNVTISATNIEGTDTETLVITIASGPCLNEGFGAGTTAPSGWAFTSIGGTYATGGMAAPSLKLDNTSDMVQTPSLSNATELSFWIKGNGTDAASTLLIEGFNGAAWVAIATISNLPTTGTTITYNSSTTPGLPVNIQSFRFTYTKSLGNLALDDVKVICGVTTPTSDINVTGNGLAILDGDTTPSASDGTYFGTTTTATNSIKTFTIHNSGALDLVLNLPITLTDVSAPQEFTVTQPALSTIPPGGSTTFTITFNSGVEAVFANTINISSNDTDEAIYNYDIQAVASDIVVTATVFKPGDLIFVGYDSTADASCSGQTDKFYIATLVDISPGTEFLVVNSRYESGALANVRTDRWYSGSSDPYEDPGIIKFKLNGINTINAGSIISFRADGFVVSEVSVDDVPTSDLSASAGSGFQCNISSSAPDQIYIMQGAFTPFGTTGVNRYNTFNGRILFGLTNGTVWVPFSSAVSSGAVSSSRVSRLPDDIECFNIESTSLNGVTYYRNNSTHTGSKNQLLLAIMDTSNWTIPSNSGCMNVVEDFSTSVSNDAVGKPFIINSGNPDGTWTGGTDTDWFKCGNWEGLSVPKSVTDVIIPNVSIKPTIGASPPKFPIGAFSNNITIENSGSLTMSNTLSRLNLYGNWTNNAGNVGFSEGSGTVYFEGSTPQIINDVSPEGTETFYNLVLNNDFQTTVSNDIIAAGNLTVNTGKTLTISANDYVQVNKTVTNNGTFDILNNGSLVQTEDGYTDVGSISMKRTASIRKYDYVYWSSPVANFHVSGVSPGTSSGLIYKWNTTIANSNGGFGNWENANENMVGTKGYIIRGPNAFNNTTPQALTATFIGVANNGIYTPTISRGTYTGPDYPGANGITVTKYDDNWNLVGNPYPSAIKALDFLTANANLDGFVNLWTHGTLPGSALNPFYGSYAYNYTPNDYITFNGTGPSTPAGFDGYIAAGQGFFVMMDDGAADATQTITFNNSMRSKGYDNAQFYRNSASSLVEGTEKHRIWLDLISSTNAINRMLVGYVSGATLGRDRLYDAVTKVDNNQNFYSLLTSQAFKIQGRPVPFDANDQVSLGVTLPASGSYTIALGATDGLFQGVAYPIFLEDKLLNIIHDLKQAPYSFNAVAGKFDNRFVLRYTNVTLGNDDFAIIESNVAVATGNQEILVKSQMEPIKSIAVYDVLGRVIFEKNNINATEFTILNIVPSQQALIVRITLENGQTLNKKIVF